MSSPATIDDTAAGVARVEGLRLRLVSSIDDVPAAAMPADRCVVRWRRWMGWPTSTCATLDVVALREWLVGVEQVRRIVERGRCHRHGSGGSVQSVP